MSANTCGWNLEASDIWWPGELMPKEFLPPPGYDRAEGLPLLLDGLVVGAAWRMELEKF